MMLIGRTCTDATSGAAIARCSKREWKAMQAGSDLSRGLGWLYGINVVESFDSTKCPLNCILFGQFLNLLSVGLRPMPIIPIEVMRKLMQ